MGAGPFLMTNDKNDRNDIPDEQSPFFRPDLLGAFLYVEFDENRFGGAMTLHAAPLVTLGVESHDGVVWLCAIEHGESRKLARFADEASVAVYRRATNLRDRSMHEMGRQGL